jgi:TfoX/Sxy family transcriptional regulator of competence genes
MPKPPPGPEPQGGKKWRRAPAELVEFFITTLQLFPEAEPRRMFGYPCAFINGQMFTGVHQESMILRLSPEDRQRFLQQHEAALFEPMPGRPMKEYVVVPPTVLADADQLESWLEKSLAYAKSLPPKERKK